MKDVSKQTVVVLAILTIIISLLGVATIFYETSKVETVTIKGEETATGRITLKIGEQKPTESTTEGSINLDINTNDM